MAVVDQIRARGRSDAPIPRTARGGIAFGAAKITDTEWVTNPMGVRFADEQCGPGFTWPAVCDPGNLPAGDKVSHPQTVCGPYVPYWVGDAEECPRSTVGEADALARVRRRVVAWHSNLVAEVLWSGLTAGVPYGGPSLASVGSNINVPATISASPALLVAELVRSMRTAGYRGPAVIHAPDWAIPSFAHAHLLEWVGDRAFVAGFPAILDAGYPGTGPATAPGPAPDGQTWVYVTGPVEWGVGPGIDPGDGEEVEAGVVRETIEPRLNLMRAQVEVLATHRFSCCNVFAALMDLC